HSNPRFIVLRNLPGELWTRSQLRVGPERGGSQDTASLGEWGAEKAAILGPRPSPHCLQVPGPLSRALILCSGGALVVGSEKLEEQDRRALSIKEQLQREHRFLKRRLEQLSGMEFGTGELDSVGSGSDVDDHYSL
ncbi:hypothetical protein E2I00_001322, partial [Balaenoptera physalus]